jgi:2-polyprenyl-6-hydroxyphenyl methylase / 3-demethylubiquinone-9 3-methyltransferase
LDSTVDTAQVAHFDRKAAGVWEPRGAPAWMHKYNAVRVPYVRDTVCRHFGRDPKCADCLRDLRVLDIGCGAGLLCEPLARLGATVVGADAGASLIEEARRHAQKAGLAIDYRCTTAEALADTGERFDVVLAMEVLEHVADSELFARCCAELTDRGGVMMLSTINRTFKSFVQAIVMAEYVLRLLKRGTHRWTRFVTPQEIAAAAVRDGFRPAGLTGVTMKLSTRALQLSPDTNVNYMLALARTR